MHAFSHESALLLLAIGAAGGFLSGLLGVGGGLIFVPTLYFFFSAAAQPEYAMHLAVGSSLAVIIATVIASSRAHHRKGAVDLALLKSWGPFLAAGVVAGSLVAGLLQGRALTWLFAFVTLAMACYMGFGRDRQRPVPKFLTLNVQRFCCACIGALAALTGMGGAVLTIPMMTATGLPMQKAVGTGAALGVLVSAPGVLGYVLTGLPHMRDLPPLSLGYVNLGAAALVMASSVPLAPLGARASHAMDRKLLRRAFACLLIAVSLRMFWEAHA
jgi:uncharacterized membrane protein YfcA